MAAVVGTTVIARPGQRVAGAGIVLLTVPLAIAFSKADRRAATPLLPRAVLRIQPLRRGAAGAFLNTAATSSAMTLATLYLQDTLRHSPLQAAAMLMPFSLAVVAGSALAAPALHRIGPQPTMATGLAVIAAADAALIVAATHGWALSACVATAGVGLGLSSVAATTLGTTVPATLRGTASGIINTAAQLGTATGIAAMLLIEAVTTGPPGPGTAPPTIAWAAAAAIAAAGALASSIRARSHQEQLTTPSIRHHPPADPSAGESTATNQSHAHYPVVHGYHRQCVRPEDRAKRQISHAGRSVSCDRLSRNSSDWGGKSGAVAAI